MNNSPFRFTLTGLGKYRALGEKSWQFPAAVVVGAAPQDFALYFNLSRMRPGVCWLLPDWIEANKAARSRAPGNVPVFEPWSDVRLSLHKRFKTAFGAGTSSS